MRLLPALLTASTLLSPLAIAQTSSSPAQPAASDDGSTLVNFTAEARRVVTQDRVQATVQIESQAKTAAAAQSEVNAKMQAARNIYKPFSSIKVTTGSYNVWRNYAPEPAPKPNGEPAWTPAEREKNSYWQATQQLSLDSANRDDLLKVVAALQQSNFAVQGINFYLSREASDALRDELTTEALKTLQVRAKKMADTLGMPKVRFARISLNQDSPQMPIMVRNMGKMAMADAAAMPEPVAQGGESEVSVIVNAEVRLSE